MRRASVIAAVLLAAASLPASSAYLRYFDWSHASSPGMGRMTVDASGNLWLVSGNTLNRWTGSGWESETVPEMAEQANCVVKFSSDNTPHIIDRGADYINYYTKDAAGWHKEQVTTDCSTSGMSVNLALDSDGRPYVAYNTSDDAHLYLAGRDNDGTWDYCPVDTTCSGAAYYPDVTIDSNGDFTIAYAAENWDVKMASGRPGDWALSMVDSGAGWAPLVEVDSCDRLRMAYWKGDSHKYRLVAEQADGTSRSELVGTSGYISYYLLDLTLDAEGAPLMIWTGSGEPYPNPVNPALSEVSGYWMSSNGSDWVFRVGNGSVQGLINYTDCYWPDINCVVVGSTLFVNIADVDGTGQSEIWYAAIPEPCSVLSVVCGLVLLGTGVRRGKR